MCAHAATVLKCLLNCKSDSEFLWTLTGALNAPGMDATLGFHFPQEDYGTLYDAEKEHDAAKGRKAAQAMFDVLDPVLRHYGSYEEFMNVKMKFWNPRKPWANKRHLKFHTADGFPHAKHGSGAPYTKIPA
jgi:hypothetical protein